jgi:hypothetical protein
MKKVLLVVALLLLATPLFAADVTVTATKVGVPVGNLQQVDIGWSGLTDANLIRAFALSLTTDTNAVISNIRNFKRGESKPGNLGFGIFPARFRQYITPLNGTDVNSTGGYGWADGNYTPLSVWGDPNCGWGINTAWIVTELGTLYTGDSNAPGTSGTLFTIDVNSPGTTLYDCNLCIALDQIRGGVVKKDTTAATVTLPPGGGLAPAGCIRIPFITCVTPANEIGVATATAEGVWTGQGFTIGTKTPVVDCTHVGTVISYNPTACTTLPAAINYSYGIQATVPNEVNVILADANTAIINAGLTIGTITYECNDTNISIPAGRVKRMSPAAGTSYCGPVNLVVSSGPCSCLYVGRIFDPNTAGFTGLTVTLTQYNLWVTLGKPNCWCCTSQKRGNGNYSGSSATKTDSLDLAGVKNTANYNKSTTSANACYDFNFSGKIDSVDLAKVKNAANYNKLTGAAPPCN